MKKSLVVVVLGSSLVRAVYTRANEHMLMMSN